MDRRTFLKSSAALGAAASVLGVGCTTPTGGLSPTTTPTPSGDDFRDFRWEETTIDEMQAAMYSGEATSATLIGDHLDRIERIDWAGPRVNSIIEVNPDAEAIAAELDEERRAGRVRGPLHGIPIVLKDVIATADRMETTAGSLALVGSKVPRDAGVVERLRNAGAVILGKANLSEWNAFRGWPTRGGWSARAGIGRNPYMLDRSTGDSSSGSAAAVAASFAAGAVGLETYGSIVMPSSLCGVVGLKPTTGLVSRSGTIPISFSRDVIGPIARTVADVAALLGAMAGVDPLDPLTEMNPANAPVDYSSFLDADGLHGARIGVWRRKDLWEGETASSAGAAIERVLSVFEEQGATLVDPVDLPHWMDATGHHIGVMSTEFPHGIGGYLSGLSGTGIRSLADVVAFNEANADRELRWHPQNLMEYDEVPPLTDPAYANDLRRSAGLARRDFDAVMRQHRLDAIVAPTFVRAWLIDLLDGDPYVGNGAAGPSNAAGFPHLCVPAGFADELPIGISFMGRAWDEPVLLRLGYAFEQAVRARRPPTYLNAGEEFVAR